MNLTVCFEPFLCVILKQLALERLNKIIWYCILLYAASDIFSIVVVQAAGVSLLTLFVVKRAYLKRFSLAKSPLNAAVFFFILARIISVLLSENIHLSLPLLYKDIFFYLLFFVFVNEIEDADNRKIIQILRIVIVSGFIAALYGISVYAFGRTERISSTTSGYYTFGMHLTAVLAITLMLGRQNDIFPKRYLWWAVNIIFIAAIFLTLNRIHWIAALVAVIVAGIAKERKFLLVYGLAAALLLIFYAPVHQRLMMSIDTFDFSKRGVILKGAFMLLDKHPVFGFGPGTFREIFPLFNELTDTAIGNWHNDFVQIYLESGAVGLLAFLYLIIIAFVKGLKARIDFLKKGNLFYRDVIAGLLLSLGAFVISGFAADVVNVLFFIFLISLLSVLVSKPSV